MAASTSKKEQSEASLALKREVFGDSDGTEDEHDDDLLELLS
jgi:hypothetical protein